MATYNNFLAKQPSGLIEETAPGIDKLPFKFTGKELDEETGLYYYGARYLDPKYSKWLSGDPALNEYIFKAPIDDEAKKHNENLPGMGGVFNVVNLHVYHYAGNNPIEYVDPDGKVHSAAVQILFDAFFGEGKTQDYSKSMNFFMSFLNSPKMNSEINKLLDDFKTLGVEQKTYYDDIHFYEGFQDSDLRLAVGKAKYEITMRSDKVEKKTFFETKEVTVYTILVKIMDKYNFDEKRSDGSITSMLNNWGYDREKEGSITPFYWTFSYVIQKIE